MLRVHGRAIMNYQLSHGRFTDDWSICVARTSTEGEKMWFMSLAWRFCTTGSISRNKGFIIWISSSFAQTGSRTEADKSSRSHSFIFLDLIYCSWFVTMPAAFPFPCNFSRNFCPHNVNQQHAVTTITGEPGGSGIVREREIEMSQSGVNLRDRRVSLGDNETQYQPW